uniref:Uncharacterized protein n=1 Tax=Timema bartmani TaxID=61472 RepID=A0A7R9EPD8_9NEOP|nr:unnamed protein product [Timema bartmani]
MDTLSALAQIPLFLYTLTAAFDEIWVDVPRAKRHALRLDFSKGLPSFTSSHGPMFGLVNVSGVFNIGAVPKLPGYGTLSPAGQLSAPLDGVSRPRLPSLPAKSRIDKMPSLPGRPGTGLKFNLGVDMMDDFPEAMAPTRTGQLPEVAPLILKLRLASILRDNMITVFGYILSRPNVTMSLETYEALADIYETTRMRRIRTAELLFLLDSMAYKTPQNQFISLFTEIQKIAPRYMVGSVKVWLQSLQINEVNVNDIIRPVGGALIVDLLSGIHPKYLKTLLIPSRFKKSSESLGPESVAILIGKFFSNIIGALMDGSLEMSQPLAACLLLHVPKHTFIPEVEESEQYLSDILFENRAELLFAVTELKSSELTDPYVLLRAVLSRLANEKNIDRFVKESAAIVLPSIFVPTNAIYDPDFEALTPIISQPTINYNLLFKYIAPGEYPDDIVKAKAMILSAINNGKLDMRPVLKQFIRHDYMSPRDLLIAIIDRIRRRATLSNDLANSVAALSSHLKLKVTAIKMEPRNIRGYPDLALFFDGFKSPGVPEVVRELADSICRSLRDVQIDWVDELSRYPTHLNSRPRQLIVRLLKSLLGKNAIRNEPLVSKVKEFLSKLDIDGEVKFCPAITCPGNAKVTPKEESTAIAEIVPNATDLPSHLEPTKDWAHLVTDSLLPALEYSPDDESRLETLRQFLAGPQLSDIVGNTFNFDDHPTVGLLLSVIMTKAMNSRYVHKNQNLYETIKLLSRKVKLDGYGSKAPEWESDPVKRTINMSAVFQAVELERVQADQVGYSLQHIYDFLIKHFQPSVHMKGFDYLKLKTRGEFLRSFFMHLLELPYIQEDTKFHIEKIIPYVTVRGPGGVPIDYEQH